MVNVWRSGGQGRWGLGLFVIGAFVGLRFFPCFLSFLSAVGRSIFVRSLLSDGVIEIDVDTGTGVRTQTRGFSRNTRSSSLFSFSFFPILTHTLTDAAKR
jgi:hypothetical protein